MTEENDNIFMEEESYLTPTQWKPIRKRKSTAGARKIQHVWTDDEINKLIASVEQHRSLWDFSSPEYKLRKQDVWRNVVDELGVDGVDANEAKVKWASLRTTYMVNVAKMRKRKSGQGAAESVSINWKFFNNMSFLEANKEQHSTSSTSTLQLECTDIDRDTFVPSPSSSFEFVADNQRNRPKLTTPTPPPSSVGSGSSQAIAILNSAVAALQSSDTNSTFCDNLLAELRTLSEPRARTLRYKISRLMMDFMEENVEPQASSGPQIKEEN